MKGRHKLACRFFAAKLRMLPGWVPPSPGKGSRSCAESWGLNGIRGLRSGGHKSTWGRPTCTFPELYFHHLLLKVIDHGQLCHWFPQPAGFLSARNFSIWYKFDEFLNCYLVFCFFCYFTNPASFVIFFINISRQSLSNLESDKKGPLLFTDDKTALGVPAIFDKRWVKSCSLHF